MKCLLMNKNRPIVLIEYNTKYNSIEKVYEIYDIKYAPLSIYNAYTNKAQNLTEAINKWFRNRGIPAWRKDVERLLERLNVETTEELINKAYALGLSDQYWIKEEKSSIKWSDINFFENDFKYKGYLQASLSQGKYNSKIEQAELMSPNNTTDGMLQKGWIIENNKRILVKGTYQASREEPINEWLAAEICKRLGFFHCNYWIDIVNDNLVSKCEDFINEDEEIISAYDIYYFEKKSNSINDYQHYISILENQGVPNARENVENMFILDYLIMNIDRHMKNFGVIRDVNTLEWVRTTPIFDNGESMQCEKLTNNINFSNSKGKFFSNTNKDYEEILKSIGHNISRIEITKLDGLVEEYREKLEKYKDYTDSSEERIDKLCEGLQYRINMLNKKINEVVIYNFWLS